MPGQSLPVYELVIDENKESELEVNYVALVDRPAIEKDFLKFNEQQRLELKFANVDEERFIISGPAMLADMPIYRKDDDGTEYMVVFKAPTIYKIVQKFFDKNFNQNINIMHDAAMKVDGVGVFESFIVDSTRGIQPMKGFEDAKDGSWFISAKVNNPTVWQAIKDGLIKGFSVEGVFGFERELSQEETMLAQIKEILNDTSED